MLGAQEWWGILALYGEQVWPAQIVLYALTLGATLWVLLRPGPVADAVMRACLVLAFGWIAVMFFLVIGTGLPGHTIFGAMFGLVALLFAVDLGRQRMTFRPPQEGAMVLVVWGIAGLIFVYPFASMAFGHGFPHTVATGSYPCPTTALGLFMLTLALPRADRLAYVLLLFWAVPLPPMIQIPKYGVYEDAIMLGVGLYALMQLIRHWSGARGTQQEGGAA